MISVTAKEDGEGRITVEDGINGEGVGEAMTEDGITGLGVGTACTWGKSIIIISIIKTLIITFNQQLERSIGTPDSV